MGHEADVALVVGSFLDRSCAETEDYAPTQRLNFSVLRSARGYPLEIRLSYNKIRLGPLAEWFQRVDILTVPVAYLRSRATQFLRKGLSMERTTTLDGSASAKSNVGSPVNSKLDDAAQAAHIATDKIADRATAQVDRSAEVVHRAVDGAAAATMSAAEWASAIARSSEANARTTRRVGKHFDTGASSHHRCWGARNRLSGRSHSAAIS